MAIYHFSSQIFTRSKGDSSVGKAAYRSAELLRDERIGVTFDYRNKSDLFYKLILLPKTAPEKLLDRGVLWNEVEKVEKRKDAQVARELTLSLPIELSEEQNIKLAHDFIQNEFIVLGMIADLSFHLGHGKNQPHVHVMLTMREVTKYGFGKKVVAWNKKELLCKWREEWANYSNKHLAKAGLDIKLDHRTNKERGIDLEPQNKIGPNDARDRLTDKVYIHQEIARRNGEKIFDNPIIAISALTKYKSTFTEIDLAKFVNTHTVDKEQFDMVFSKVKACSELVKVGVDENGRDRFTSNEMIDLEYRMVRQAQFLSQSQNYPVDFIYREKIISEYKLSESQSMVFRHITGDRDAACVIGYAGAGKSYVLSAANKIWERDGYNVIGMTLSGIAAEYLEGETGIKSYTVASRITHWENNSQKLNEKDIVVVDEAGLLGSRALARIIDEVILANAKIVMVGDTQQLQSIEAGAAFRGILERIGHVELNDIRRQNILWQREATRLLALGEIGEAFDYYHKSKMIYQWESDNDAKESMVNDWHEASLSNNKVMMMGYTRHDVAILNERAREIRKSYGELVKEHIYDTANGKKSFAIGDKIYFLKNDKNLSVKNGTIGTIIFLEKLNFKVSLNNGRIIEFDIGQYNNIDHGYASTIHKSQGMTVDRAFVLISPYMDRHATYVSMSRHRESVEIYWSKDRFSCYDNMVSTLTRERRKDLALDYLDKDFHDNFNIFSANRAVDNSDAYIKKRDYLEYFSSYSKVLDIVKNLIETVKYSFVNDRAYKEDYGKYLGDVNLDGKKFSILEKLGIGVSILKNADTTDVQLKDEVRVLHDKNTTKLIKDINNVSNTYYDDKTSFISKVSRSMISREESYIDDNIKTKDIYSMLYHKLPHILPEFGFAKKGAYYISTTEFKIDGSYGKKGKVYVYENNPGLIVDYTRGSITLWEYIGESQGIQSKDLFRYLLGLAGIKEYFYGSEDIQERSGSAKNVREIEEEKNDNGKISSSVWKMIYDYSLSQMLIKDNQIIRYAKNERGYSEEVIKACGIGYIPSKKSLIENLKNKGMSTQDLNHVQKALGSIGYSHKMVMPFYDGVGDIIGLVGRNVKYQPDSKFSKYVYSKGLVRNTTIFGIESIEDTKKVTIVEGILDALHAKAVGIKNVIGLGGLGLNAKQVDLLIDLGIKEINLCLDNDRAGQVAIQSIALQIYSKNKEMILKIVQLADNVKDIDQLIKENGARAAEECIKFAKPIEIDKFVITEISLPRKFQKIHEGKLPEIGVISRTSR